MNIPRVRSAFFLVVVAVGWFGCDSSEEQSTGNLSGVVRDSLDNIPIAGATVGVPGQQQHTDAVGRFSFQGVRTGNVEMTVGATGYRHYAEQIAISEGENEHNPLMGRAHNFEVSTSGVDWVLRVPPSLAKVRGVLLILGGFERQTITLVRGDSDPQQEPWFVAMRDAMVALASDFDLAVMGADVDDQLSPAVMAGAFEALSKFADSARHPELAEAPILAWGASQGGCYAYNTPGSSMHRLAGFVRQKASCNAGADDKGDMKLVPGYHVIGELDTAERNVGVTEGFEANRLAGALWALITQPGVAHTPMIEGDPAGLTLMILWMREVLAQRLPPSSGPLLPLMTIDPSAGWLGNRQTFEIGSAACYDDDPLTASWLPSMETAEQWQAKASSGTVVAVSDCP